MMGERRGSIINCQCIVAGFDKDEKARIVIVSELGDIFDLSDSGHAAIGSGSPFSTIYFDQYGYSINMSVEDALFFSFEAKKWAEAPRGVGRRTDIILIRKENKNIQLKLFQDGSELLETMEKFYQSKRQLMMEKQKELKEEIEKLLQGD